MEDVDERQVYMYVSTSVLYISANRLHAGRKTITAVFSATLYVTVVTVTTTFSRAI